MAKRGNGKHIPDDKRDNATGRFLKGNPGGTGNPRADVVRLCRAALDESTDPEIIMAIWRKAQSLALNGHEKMIVYVLDRVLGKPSETIKFDASVEIHEVRTQLIEYLREGAA